MPARFAAVEVKPGERGELPAIQAFFKHAVGMGLMFQTLEPYGPLTLGSTTFLRFRTDCPDLDSLLPFFQTEARAVVFPTSTGYRMVTQTTEGPIPIVPMQAAKTPGYTRKWRGTANKFWQRQFPS